MTDAKGSLRELPPDQEIKTTRLSRLRLVPLCILVVLAILATIAGGVWTAQHPFGSGVPQSTAEPGAALPEACTPGFDEGVTGDPWSGEAAAASEETWQEHAADLDGYYFEGQGGQVFLGEQHWHNASQAVGREPLDEARLDAWYAYINNMRADVEAAGAELFVVVAPAKWEIMPETLPEWMQSIRGESRVDQLMSAHPDLPFIDVRAQMAASETPVYAPLNSHWTDYGAYVAFEQIAACMAAADPSLEGIAAPAISGTTVAPDHNEFADAGWPGAAGDDWTTPTYQEPLGTMTVTAPDGSVSQADVGTQIDKTQLPSVTHNDAAPIDQRALILRDSTGNAIGPLFQSQFTETVQIQHSLDMPASMPDVATTVQETGSDVVVLMLTQRFLDIVPGIGVAP